METPPVTKAKKAPSAPARTKAEKAMVKKLHDEFQTYIGNVEQKPSVTRRHIKFGANEYSKTVFTINPEYGKTAPHEMFVMVENAKPALVSGNTEKSLQGLKIYTSPNVDSKGQPKFVSKTLLIRVGPEHKAMLRTWYEDILDKWCDTHNPVKDLWYEKSLEGISSGADTYAATAALQSENYEGYASMHIQDSFDSPHRWAGYIFGDEEYMYMNVRITNSGEKNIFVLTSRKKHHPEVKEPSGVVYPAGGVSCDDVKAMEKLVLSEFFSTGKFEVNCMISPSSISWAVGVDQTGQKQIFPEIRWGVKSDIFFRQIDVGKEGEVNTSLATAKMINDYMHQVATGKLKRKDLLESEKSSVTKKKSKTVDEEEEGTTEDDSEASADDESSQDGK